MPDSREDSFRQRRDDAFDRIIAALDERLKSAAPPVLSRFDEMSADAVRCSAERETWSLFLRGIRHLKDGAPGGQPGSMTEALSRMSLRSSTFAAALGVKPPQFEQMYFSVNYTDGNEAALFFCLRLVEAAKGDLSKSRQIIGQKILLEKPSEAFAAAAGDAEIIKKQMAFSFGVLAETYARACREFRAALENLSPPPPAEKPPGRGLSF